jgi:hypothetical protein
MNQDNTLLALSPRQRTLTGARQNWRVGQLLAFSHGPSRQNIYRFRVDQLQDGRPVRMHLVVPEFRQAAD